MTRGAALAFKKIPWDNRSSSSFPREDEKKEEITADVESDTGSFDALQVMGLSYSSSNAPMDESSAVRNDDASSTPPLKMDDESSAEALKDDGSDDSPPPKTDEDSSDLPPSEGDEDSSLLGSGFDASLDARLKELDGMPDKLSMEDEEVQDETTDTVPEEDEEANIELYPGSVGGDSVSAGVESNSSISKAAGSTYSSKEREVSSNASNDQESESASSVSAPNDAGLKPHVTSEVGSEATAEAAPADNATEAAAEEESSEGSEEGKEASKKNKPPLFPRRSKPNSLRKKKKPGIASFFRSRSNPPPPKPAGSEDNKESKGAVSVDGRIETVASEADGTTEVVASEANGRIETVASETAASQAAPSQTDASVISCSDGSDSVEVVSLESEQKEELESKQKTATSTDEDIACVKSDGTPYGIVKDASSDAEIFAKAMDRINAKLSNCTSKEIQDPWPNPWADAGSANLDSLYPAPGQAVNPHIVSNEKPPDSVLENVVGVVLSSEAANTNEDLNGAESGVNHGGTDNGTVDDILPNPASLNPDLVGATLNKESNNAPSQSQEPVDNLDNTRQKQGTSTSNESQSGMDAALEALEANWDDTEADDNEGSSSSSGGSQSANSAEKEEEKQVVEKEEENQAVEKEQEVAEKEKQEEENQVEEKESNMKGKRQSSLWKRTKSMVKTRRNSHKNLYQDGQAAKKAQAEEPKKQKFKLGYLCLLAPCNKRLSTIKEVEGNEPKEAKQPSGRKENEVAEAIMVEKTEVEAGELESEEDQPESDPAYDDLVDLDCVDSGEVGSHDIPPPTGTPSSAEPSQVTHKSRSASEDIPRESPKKTSKTPKTDIEESKSDLVQIEMVDSKLSKNKSWITGGQSVESLMMAPGDFVHKTFSDVSTIGDLSEIESGPNVINSINFYVNAAKEALQHNLYDVPSLELERFRALATDYACFQCNEETSLSDRGLSMTMSSDSGAIAVKPELDVGKKIVSGKAQSEGGAKNAAVKKPQLDRASGKKIKVPEPIPETGDWKPSNPFTVATSAFNELIDVLEFNPMAKKQQGPVNRPAMSPTTKFEEQKIEMFGSVSS